MSWGTFEVYNSRGRLVEVHVAPCYKSGELGLGHILSGFCDCCPLIDSETEPEKAVVYIHNQIH